MVDDFILQSILNSTVIVSIFTAIIYFFGTLINLRSVNRSKEDTCIYGLYFVMFFIAIPSFIYYFIFHRNQLNLERIDCIIITSQLFIILILAFILKDFDKFLQDRWPEFSKKHIRLSRPLKYLSKIRNFRNRPCELSDSSPKKNCAKSRCMDYCLCFFICSTITVSLTLYLFLGHQDANKSLFSLKYVSSALSLIILSLVACTLPSVHNEYNNVRVFMSEDKDSFPYQLLSGILLQNSDTFIRICLNDNKHLEINKAFIKYIEIDGNPKKEKLLECILSMPRNLVIFISIFIFLWILWVLMNQFIL